MLDNAEVESKSHNESKLSHRYNTTTIDETQDLFENEIIKKRYENAQNDTQNYIS